VIENLWSKINSAAVRNESKIQIATQGQRHNHPYPPGSLSLPNPQCGIPDYGGTDSSLYSPTAVSAMIEIRVRKKQESSWAPDGWEYFRTGYHQLEATLVFAKTKQSGVSSTRLGSAYRQYLHQRQALRHMIVLIIPAVSYYYTQFQQEGRPSPISLVTPPSLHPMSKTRASLNNPGGRTESRWSCKRDRFV
jgi:hypothetical protein